MVWVNLFVLFVLVVSVITGLKEGAVRRSFNLAAVLIATFVAGRAYHLVAGWFSYIHEKNLENFIGFFLAFAVAVAVSHIVFLLPRHILQSIWKRGLLFRLVGGLIAVVDAGIGMVVFASVLRVFPIFDWLAQSVAGSGMVSLVVRIFGFVQVLLPPEFHPAAAVASALL